MRLSKLCCLLAVVFYGSMSIAQNESPEDTLVAYYKNEGLRLRGSNPQKSAELLHKGLALSRKLKDTIDIGFFHRKLISQKGYAGQVDSARFYFREAMKNPAEIEELLDGHVHSELAEVFHRNEQLDSAEHYYARAGDLYLEAQDSIGVVISKANLSNLMQLRGDFQGAITALTEAAILADTTQYRFIKSNIFGNIAAVYDKMEDNENAYKYNLLAYEEAAKDTHADALVTSILGLVRRNRKQENYEEAQRFVQEAEKIIDSLDMTSARHLLWYQEGMLSAAMGDDDMGIEFIEKALLGFEKFKFNTETVIDAKVILADLYKKSGNFDRAIAGFEAAKEESLEQDLPLSMEGIYGGLALSYAGIGKYSKAFENQKLYQELKDSIFSLEKQNAFKEVETKYQTAQKEIALAETRATLAESELKVKKRNYTIYGVLGIAGVLGLLGYLFFKQQRLKNRQQAKEFELQKALVRIETQNKLQEQRLRISRDLHDNIGSQLSFITSSLDNLKYGIKEKDESLKTKITDIGSFTKTTINELRDTIWAMNKESIELHDLEGRIGNLLDQARSASPETTFLLKVDKDLDKTYAFTSVEGVNLYRVIQESINNAVKYSEAPKITIEMEKTIKGIRTEINDDGKGFDASIPKMGNGLRNMKKRAEDIGAVYNFVSEEDKGTTISLELLN